jgi:LPS export ABC transporter protein LptC
LIKKNLFLSFILSLFFVWSCTFNYGDKDPSEEEEPDLIMENVEYMRVRSGDPLARIVADRVERYENINLMKLENITFEQYGEKGDAVNVYGNVGIASVEIASGDIFMDRNVRLEVNAEDIILDTYQLEWKDEPKSISSGRNDPVYIYRNNGTMFTGIGLQGNARSRTWEFLGNVRGIYIHED